MLRKIWLIICISAVMLLLAGCGNHEKPTEPGKVIIEDGAGLISASDEEYLIGEMEKLTEYGNIALVTINENYKTTDVYAELEYEKLFGRTSGALFLIDMDRREIYLEVGGYIGDVISSGKARTITDNVYRYASRGEYWKCARDTFDQVKTLMEGGRIAQTMKYVSNAFIAVLIALLGNFILLRRLNAKKEVSVAELDSANTGRVSFTNCKTDVTSRKVVVLNNSSGGRGGFGGGFGGGGGHFSHGGGHRF
ncbi:MAG: TPM domain-containing protein [Lachnospiraceae bacterium]|nr:TPM domain-containing protein [Lachnospiraceae bacterium]